MFQDRAGFKMDRKSSQVAASRRAFLVASSTALTGLTLQHGMPVACAAPEAEATGGTAKSTILFFLSGGASHVDMWDMKPEAPLEYRGPFQPISTSAPGVRLCEHLPMLSQQAHHLALLNSVGASVNTNDHHAGYYYNLTGHEADPTFLSLGNNRTPYADDWPYIGSVVAAKKPNRANVPGLITLPQKPSPAPYTRPGQFAGRLGLEFDPLYVDGSREQPLKFQVPALVLSGTNTAERLGHRRALLETLDHTRRSVEQLSTTGTWNRQQERAFSLLLSRQTTSAFEVANEPVEVRQRYGENVNGMSLLLARRLVEVGVPFITVFWMEDLKIDKKCNSAGGWDTHANNFGCLKDHLLPEFDRAYSALLEDLSQRGLLDSTLVMITSEMGRKPKIGDIRSGGVYGSGRDHWTHLLTDVLAGGGIRGGQTYGASDRFAEYPADRPITPAHVAKTVYHAMGIHDLEVYDKQNRPFNLLPEGEPISGLF